MLNGIYEYPVELSRIDVKNALGIDVTDETEEVLIGAHIYIYDVIIYPTFNEDIKNRIIEKYRAQLEKPLKKALLAQFDYMYRNGDVGNWNGFLQSDGNSVDSKEQQDILTKMIAPRVINILKGAPIDLLYAGG